MGWVWVKTVDAERGGRVRKGRSLPLAPEGSFQPFDTNENSRDTGRSLIHTLPSPTKTKKQNTIDSSFQTHLHSHGHSDILTPIHTDTHGHVVVGIPTHVPPSPKANQDLDTTSLTHPTYTNTRRRVLTYFLRNTRAHP